MSGRRAIGVASLLAVAACQGLMQPQQPYYYNQQPYAAPAPEPQPADPYATAPADPVDAWTRVALDPKHPIAAAPGPCRIPTYTDEAAGFTVGRPAGWQLDFGTGTLVVSPEDEPFVGALIFPARLRRADLGADQLATAFADQLAARVRASGGSLALADKVTDGRVARATALATFGGTRVRGTLEVNASSSFMTIALYWAPEARLGALEPTLRQVVGCFKRATTIAAKRPPSAGPRVTHVGGRAPASAAIPLRAHAGRYVTVQLPDRWTITTENQHGIDAIAQDHSAGFSWVYLLGTALPRADVYAMQAVQQFHPNAQMIGGGWKPAPAGWALAEVEWQSKENGATLRGVQRVAVGNGALISTSWIAVAPQWERWRPTLETMAASLQVTPAALAQVQADIRRQLASYPPVRPAPAATGGGSSGGGGMDLAAKWQNDDRHSQAWSDTMLGQERARSPSTGEEYVVPTNAWSETGPQGAGYYRATPGGGAERLEVPGE